MATPNSQFDFSQSEQRGAAQAGAPADLPTERGLAEEIPAMEEPAGEALDKALQEELESFNSPSTKRNPLVTRFIFLGIGLALVAVLVVGAYLAYNRYVKNSASVQTVKNAVQDVTQNPNADDDHDGLTNKEEADNKTDAQNPDTDADDLKDGIEVHTYHSNPTKPDTDGDGYSDGQEVVNGFNPIGAGKLRN